MPGRRTSREPCRRSPFASMTMARHCAFQAEQVLGGAPGAHTQRCVEIAANEQEEQERDGGVEIDLLAAPMVCKGSWSTERRIASEMGTSMFRRRRFSAPGRD